MGGGCSRVGCVMDCELMSGVFLFRRDFVGNRFRFYFVVVIFIYWFSDFG